MKKTQRGDGEPPGEDYRREPRLRLVEQCLHCNSPIPDGTGYSDENIALCDLCMDRS